MFVPETPQMKHDTAKFHHSIIIDARLKQNHNPHMIQSIIMSVTRSDYPFPLTHLAGVQYLLMLPQGIERHTFLKNHTKPLQDLGYVVYPWGPGVNGRQMSLRYKMWVELRGMPAQSWNILTLMHAVGSFGALLDHTPMTNVNSLEKMVAVVGVSDLSLVPQNTMVWVKGVGRDVEVGVLGWIEEALPFNPNLDTTPTDAFFQKVTNENLIALAGSGIEQDGREVVTIEFNTLYALWQNMSPGEEKVSLGKTLKASPFFPAQVNPNPTTITAAKPSMAHALGKLPVKKFTSKEKGKSVAMEESITDITGEGKGPDSSQVSIKLISDQPENASPVPDSSPKVSVQPPTIASQIQLNAQQTTDISRPKNLQISGPVSSIPTQIDSIDPNQHSGAAEINPGGPSTDGPQEGPVLGELTDVPISDEHFSDLDLSEYEDFGYDSESGMHREPEPEVVEPYEIEPEEVIADEGEPEEPQPALNNPDPEPNGAVAGPDLPNGADTPHKSLRRSARISVKGPKSYASPKAKNKKAGCRAPLSAASVKEKQQAMLNSLSDEVLAANPLQEDQVRQIDNYCGIIPNNSVTPKERNEAGTSRMGPNRDMDGHGYVYEESALAALRDDSDGDLSEMDEEA